MATGGGSSCPDAGIDPDIADISPALLVEVPTTVDSDSFYGAYFSEEVQIEHAPSQVLPELQPHNLSEPLPQDLEPQPQDLPDPLSEDAATESSEEFSCN